MRRKRGFLSAMKTSEPWRVQTYGTPAAAPEPVPAPVARRATQPLGRIQWAWTSSIPASRISRRSARAANGKYRGAWIHEASFMPTSRFRVREYPRRCQRSGLT